MRVVIRNSNYTQLWIKIFNLSKQQDMKKPLTTKILSNPDHNIVKILLYIYSMQSFVFKEINLASRNKDHTKIKFYGPLASALGYVIHAANQRKKVKLPPKFIVYRGLTMSSDEIQSKFRVNKNINLLGFTSTTLEKEQAFGFAIKQAKLNPSIDDPAKTPVVMEIEFKGQQQYFELNTKEYSAYPTE